MAAKNKKTDYRPDPTGVNPTDYNNQEYLNSIKILISRDDLRNSGSVENAEIISYYGAAGVPSNKLFSKTWAEVNTLFTLSDGGPDKRKLVLVVSNINNPTYLSIEWYPLNSVTSDALSRLGSSIYAFTFDEYLYKALNPSDLRTLGLDAIIGKMTISGLNTFILKIKHTFIPPPAGGGPPYAGAKIPNP